MGKETGFYVLRKDYEITEFEAMKLIRQLTADMIAAESKANWSFDSNRSNLSAFVGNFNSRVYHMASQQTPEGVSVNLVCHEDGQYLYTIVDLCYEPEKSELLELYVRVSRRVHSEAWESGRLTMKRTIIVDEELMPSK